MPQLGKTTWVDNHLQQSWQRIAAHVPPEWMPLELTEEDMLIETGGRRRFGVEELGCGHYGCVMPTSVPGLVCKLSSDISEAHFVAADLTLPEALEGDERGIVRYYRIFALQGQQHRKRPLFVLWRDEAYDLGFLFDALSSTHTSKRVTEHYGYDAYQYQALRTGFSLLQRFLAAAHDARDRILKGRFPLDELWAAYEDAPTEGYRVDKASPTSFGFKVFTHHRGLRRTAAALRYCSFVAMEMSNTDVIYPVGSALFSYLNDDGLLLADVHANNIGRTNTAQAVITDPGHVVAVHPRWTNWPPIPAV